MYTFHIYKPNYIDSADNASIYNFLERIKYVSQIFVRSNNTNKKCSYKD